MFLISTFFTHEYWAPVHLDHELHLRVVLRQGEVFQPRLPDHGVRVHLVSPRVEARVVRPMQRQVERNLVAGYRGHLDELPQGAIAIFIAAVGAFPLYTDRVDQVIVVELVDQQDIPGMDAGRVSPA